MGSLHRSKLHIYLTPNVSYDYFRFLALGVKSASRTSEKHLIESFVSYAASVVQEAEDRYRKHIRSVQDYLDVRHFTVGAYPSFAMIELGYDLPDEVKYHPTVVALVDLTRDMIILDNVRLV